MKIYGGLFYFFPVIFIICAFVGRLFLAILISIPLAALSVPDTVTSGNRFMIKHGFRGLLASSDHVTLYETNFILLKKLAETGIRRDELDSLKYTRINQITSKADTITVHLGGEKKEITFIKSNPHPGVKR